MTFSPHAASQTVVGARHFEWGVKSIQMERKCAPLSIQMASISILLLTAGLEWAAWTSLSVP